MNTLIRQNAGTLADPTDQDVVQTRLSPLIPGLLRPGIQGLHRTCVMRIQLYQCS